MPKKLSFYFFEGVSFTAHLIYGLLRREAEYLLTGKVKRGTFSCEKGQRVICFSSFLLVRGNRNFTLGKNKSYAEYICGRRASIFIGESFLTLFRNFARNKGASGLFA